MQVFNCNKQIQHSAKVPVANKVQGRVRAALNILSKIFGADQKWLALVERTKQDIEDARQRRGAPERPVFKKADEYLAESRLQQVAAKPQSKD